MKKIARFLFGNFTILEWCLWLFSVTTIVVLFLAFGAGGTLSLIASLIGATSLIFIAKGNVVGQALTIVFSVLYGIVSYQTAYYGEMITYLGMTAPIAALALVSWLRHPSKVDRSVVEVKRLPGREWPFLLLLAGGVTLLFYFILKWLGTASLLFGTVSVFTSFVAVYLAVRRCPLYALGYVANDIVLIILWSIATANDRQYFPMILCFSIFFINDFYGFFNWQRLAKRQNATAAGIKNDQNQS